MQFNLDPNAAREGSDRASNRINATGAYTGKIIQAYVHKGNETQSEGLKIDFESDEGQTVSGLYICYKNKEGQDNKIGINQINALMACLKLRQVNQAQGTISTWDYDQNKEVSKPAIVFTEFIGQPVGLFLQKELSTYDGTDREKMVFFAPFNAETRQTSIEILDNKPAETIQKMIEQVGDKDKRQSVSRSAQNNMQDPYADPFNDDIPY